RIQADPFKIIPVEGDIQNAAGIGQVQPVVQRLGYPDAARANSDYQWRSNLATLKQRFKVARQAPDQRFNIQQFRHYYSRAAQAERNQSSRISTAASPSTPLPA